MKPSCMADSSWIETGLTVSRRTEPKRFSMKVRALGSHAHLIPFLVETPGSHCRRGRMCSCSCLSVFSMKAVVGRVSRAVTDDRAPSHGVVGFARVVSAFVLLFEADVRVIVQCCLLPLKKPELGPICILYSWTSGDAFSPLIPSWHRGSFQGTTYSLPTNALVCIPSFNVGSRKGTWSKIMHLQ